jgi:hypothetical protein
MGKPNGKLFFWTRPSDICLRSYSRKGTPTPVLPDFTNLKAQWAAITPSGVALSAHSPPPVTPRPCPSSTAGGWAVDPSSPLPTLGEIVTQASNSAPDPTGAHTAGSNGTSAASPSETIPATSTTARANAVQFRPHLLFFDDDSLAGCILALLTIGLAVVLLL